MHLKILVGTVTGTAMSVAQAIALELADAVDECRVLPMDGLTIDVFADEALCLLVTSTTGAGDVPDNAQGLYASLLQAPRYLGALRYGVVALGDALAHAATFAEAGRRFDAALEDLGARRVGELLTLDAGSDEQPEATAAAWSRDWLALARAA